MELFIIDEVALSADADAPDSVLAGNGVCPTGNVALKPPEPDAATGGRAG